VDFLVVNKLFWQKQRKIEKVAAKLHNVFASLSADSLEFLMTFKWAFEFSWGSCVRDTSSCANQHV